MVLSKRIKFSADLSGALVCLLFLAAGCAQTATLTLKFTPQDLTTYKVVTLTQRSIEFEGSLPKKEDAFKGGRNQEGTEMTFTQQIQSIDDKGNAVAKITIEALKYHSTVKNRPIIEFDSSKEEGRRNPLAKLIGQSYTIKIAPTGEVTEVIDVKQAQDAVKGEYVADIAASKLFSPDEIKERHGLMVMPVSGKNRLRTGDSWSNVKNFSFGIMGSKSYERIYTLKGLEADNDRQVAVIEMDAIPTAETAEQLHQQQAAYEFLKMFDNTETYAGRLTLDLTAGKVEKCLEKLLSEWVIVDPWARQDEKEPAVMRMSATRLYRLEKVD
jgi:hypothetical protein